MNKNVIDTKKKSLFTKIQQPSSFISSFTPAELSTYIGQKGYTILKKELSNDQLTILKNELIAKPFIQGGCSSSSNITYPVYRESANKIYIPRFFGEKYFGLPKDNKIKNGDDINVSFNGKLRDEQVPVVETYIKHVTQNENKGGGGLLELCCAFGKTILSINIISRLKKKTLIIVHKEFLMNQWIERMSEFLPDARIGKIQGKVIDIENKDIVICMLQSISMKEYDYSIFESFGLTIIDEVHHISSQVFSNALFKIVTKYMLGLSATMNRKDGTTHIFKMFLGDIVYKGTRDHVYDVIVRAVEYKSTDENFNKVVLDFRGNVQYSSMISKLCEYSNRSDFILKVLSDTFSENENQQIMLLAHNKNLLKYLHDAIKERNIANGSVGYYVGGMKEKSLKETEGKKIVIATYSMAAEALDIKTLTTLIMCTPKTDIEQSIGRIMRDKNGKKIIVDIVDSHDSFKNQWNKRRKFYKKQNYKIIYCDNTSYTSNTDKWKINYDPTKKNMVTDKKYNYDNDDEDDYNSAEEYNEEENNKNCNENYSKSNCKNMNEELLKGKCLIFK
jgi:superfamily II DNA or RNA helicase